MLTNIWKKLMMKTLWVYKIPFDMLVYSIMFTPKTLPEYE